MGQILTRPIPTSSPSSSQARRARRLRRGMAAALPSARSCLARRPLTSIAPPRLPFELRSHNFLILPRIPRPPRAAAAAIRMSAEGPARSPALSSSDRKFSRLLRFAKYQGLGNDFIMVDNRGSLEPRVTLEQSVKLCDRNFGIRADGVIFVMPVIHGTDYSMRIFNSDSSESEMCGNGVCCFA